MNPLKQERDRLLGQIAGRNDGPIDKETEDVLVIVANKELSTMTIAKSLGHTRAKVQYLFDVLLKRGFVIHSHPGQDGGVVFRSTPEGRTYLARTGRL